MAKQELAVQKRQQIHKANRTMFFWVAGVSAIVGVAIVVSVFLMQKVLFREKVIAEYQKTDSILIKNNQNANKLIDSVRALNTNVPLSSAMIDGEANPVQVVLDALPARANSSAFGASLEKKILMNERIIIESLRVDPVFGIESQDTMASTVQENTVGAEENAVYFQFIISSDADDVTALKEALQRIERSIRPITMTKIIVERQGKRAVLTATGMTYYQPAKNVGLRNKTVKP